MAGLVLLGDHACGEVVDLDVVVLRGPDHESERFDGGQSIALGQDAVSCPICWRVTNACDMRACRRAPETPVAACAPKIYAVPVIREVIELDDPLFQDRAPGGSFSELSLHIVQPTHGVIADGQLLAALAAASRDHDPTPGSHGPELSRRHGRSDGVMTR